MIPKIYTLLKFLFIISISVSFFLSVSAQSNRTNPPPIQTSFRPSIAVVVGIFSILFSLTFLLLMYAKFCHSSGYEFFNHNPNIRLNNILHPNSVLHTFSGLDKAVIESLPFFQFSSLKGSREGLECAVCISKFDDTEILRLLPKCKHAFHIDCVDKWLESHSSCPLCRCRINPDDVNRFKYSNSSRFLFREEENHDHDHDGFELDVFVERESDDCNKKKKDELLMKNDELILHKFRHRIIVSDAVFKSRWSDMRSSDFVTLNCDMLSLMSSKRFVEKKRESDVENSMQSRSLMSSGKRCMSEITDLSRFQAGKSSNLNSNSNGEEEEEEEVRRVWLPIARKTVRLFSGKEGKTEFDHQQNNEGRYSNV